MDNSVDSLEICSKQCLSKCCQSTPPALTKIDIKRIEDKIGNNLWKKKIEFNQKTTVVVAKKNNRKDCFFLSEEGLCKIYEYRPLDCKLFPLFIKIKKEEEEQYKIKWLIWYCPLTEAKELEVLYKDAQKLLYEIIKENPEEIFDYQESMYISGGYKKKHFFKQEYLKI